MRAEKKRKENGAAGGQIDRLFFLKICRLGIDKFRFYVIIALALSGFV